MDIYLFFHRPLQEIDKKNLFYDIPKKLNLIKDDFGYVKKKQVNLCQIEDFLKCLYKELKIEYLNSKKMTKTFKMFYSHIIDCLVICKQYIDISFEEDYIYEEICFILQNASNYIEWWVFLYKKLNCDLMYQIFFRLKGIEK